MWAVGAIWAVGATASAGSVFINGVHVEPSQLAGMNFEDVSVRMDAAGDVHITAPQYTVRPAEPTPPRPLATGPVAPGPVAPAPVALAPRTAPPTGAVTPGRWWLYVHDQASTGHAVRVVINDAIVKTVASGDVVILDIGRFLVVGTNAIRLEATSSNPTGGPLYVYVGQGQDNNGTVDLGTPEIQFSVGQSKQGLTQQDFTLQVYP